MGKFLAESEEKTYQKFMDIAGLGKEYKSAKFIPEIKSVLEKFAECGYLIEEKEILNRVDAQMLMWRMTLFLDGNEIVRQDIKITIHTISRK